MSMRQNDAEQTRMGLASSSANSQTTISLSSDTKILDEKVYDTSSSANAFSGVSAGDIIKMTGWDQEENNRIFIVTEVESSGEYIKVDKELKDVKSADTPSAGITVYTSPESLTISGVTTEDVLVEVLNFNSASSSAAELDRDYFAITSADTVSSFAVTESGDQILICWAKLSAG